MEPMFQAMHDVLRPSFQQGKLISTTLSGRADVSVTLVAQHLGLGAQMRHLEDGYPSVRLFHCFTIHKSPDTEVESRSRRQLSLSLSLLFSSFS